MKIIVTSDDDDMLKIASNMGVSTHKNEIGHLILGSRQILSF